MNPPLGPDVVGLVMNTYDTYIVDSTRGIMFEAALRMLSIPLRRTVYSFALNQNFHMSIIADHTISGGHNGVLYQFNANLQECTQHSLMHINPGDLWYVTNSDIGGKVVAAVWEYDAFVVVGIMLLPGEQVTLIAKPGHRYQVTAVGSQAIPEGEDDIVQHVGVGVTLNLNLAPNTRHMITVPPLPLQQGNIQGNVIPLSYIRITNVGEIIIE